MKKSIKTNRLKINHLKNYVSQCQPLGSKNTFRMGSPTIIKPIKGIDYDYDQRMKKMLDVKANEISDSHWSYGSEQSKLKFQNKLAQANSKNENLKMLSMSPLKVKRFKDNSPSKRLNKFSFKAEQPRSSLIEQQNSKELFAEFPENSTLELEGSLRLNKPFLFGAKPMNLKSIKGGR